MGSFSSHPLRLEVESGLFIQPGVISPDLGGVSISLFVLQCKCPPDRITLPYVTFMTCISI